jgi:hypothetical protein
MSASGRALAALLACTLAAAAAAGLLVVRATDGDPPRPGWVAGTVVDDEGRLVAGAKVGVLQGVVSEESLVQVTLDNCYRTTTDADGRFEVYLPALGNVTPRDNTGWSIWVREDARGLMGAVTIQAPPEEPLEIRLAPACTIHTTALDAEGKPIPDLGTSVSLVEAGYTSPGPASDGRGEVRIGPLPAGLGLRVAFSANVGYLALTDEWRDEDRPAITLSPGETRELPALRLAVAQRTLRGTVFGDDGQTVAGAKVRAIIPSAFPTETLTDADGAFALTGLLPTRDDLWVLASHPAEPLYVGQRIAPTTGECRLALRPLTSVRGQLANAQGQPATDLHVRVVSFLRVGAGDFEDYWLFGGVPRPTPDLRHTDTEGFWEVGDLVSGAPYMVLISNTVLSFDKEHLALVADADNPVDLGLVMSLN